MEGPLATALLVGTPTLVDTALGVLGASTVVTGAELTVERGPEVPPRPTTARGLGETSSATARFTSGGMTEQRVTTLPTVHIRRVFPTHHGALIALLRPTIDARRYPRRRALRWISQLMYKDRMEERLKQLLVLGREHYERREYDRAERLLEQVVEGSAPYADVYNMMGVISHERGDFVGATRHFERAVELNPAYTEALLNLVIGYNDIGQYERARETFARVRAVETSTGERAPDEFALGKIANMHAALAMAYSDANCIQDAIRELERAVALRPAFADLRVKLAGLYKDAGRLVDARRELEHATGSNPAYTHAHIQLGVVLLACGENALAASKFREVLASDPSHRTAKVYLRLAEQRATPVHSSRPPQTAASHGAPDDPPLDELFNEDPVDADVAAPHSIADDPTHVP